MSQSDLVTRIARLLGIEGEPGAEVGPSSFQDWPQSLKPMPIVASLFLQFKRPEWMTYSQADEWQEHKEPYLRVRINPLQQRRLLDLEETVEELALVAYAAPDLWKATDLWEAQGTGTVLSRSRFIAPLSVSDHKRWTWGKTKGDLVHSQPREAQVWSATELRNLLFQLGQRQHPRLHIERLAELLSGEASRLEGRERGPHNLVKIAEALARYQVTWVLAVFSEAEAA